MAIEVFVLKNWVQPVIRTHTGIWKMNICSNNVNLPPTTYNVKRLPNITILEDVFCILDI